MKTKELIKVEENIFSKIKNFFKKLFYKTNEDLKENEDINNSLEYNRKKKQFFELYEKSKNGEIDLFSINTEDLEKMCDILEEEIKIKEKSLQEKLEKIKKYE